MKYNLEYDRIHNEYRISWSLLNSKDLTMEDFYKLDISPDDLKSLSARRVVISGKVPLAVYIYSALAIVPYFPEKIFVEQANGLKTQILPIEKYEADSSIIYPRRITDPSYCFLEYQSLHEAPFCIEQLKQFEDTIPDAYAENALLILSGKLCNWLAAALAIIALKKGWKNIGWFSPRNDDVLTIIPKIERRHIDFSLEQPGKIIGIGGDPNSGKSIFANLLEVSAIAEGVRAWHYDCDYSSPTPPWYLNMVNSGNGSAGNSLRDNYKRTWVSGAEQELVSSLNKVKKYISYVIADLPGGKTGNTQLERIPAGREILMKEIADLPGGKTGNTQLERIPAGREILMKGMDYFVIVSKKNEDGDSGESWRNDLARHKLADRIILTIYSESPNEPPRLWYEDGQWHICGLSRNRAAFPKELQRELWKLVKKAVDEKN